jgi:hypothetical protein
MDGAATQGPSLASTGRGPPTETVTGVDQARRPSLGITNP